MTRRILPFLLIGLLVSSPAFAQTHAGVRAGVSGDPTQFFFGGHIETAPLLENFTFRPNAEIGVGDGATLLAFNFEFAYKIAVKRQPFHAYIGGGPALVIASGPTPVHHSNGNSDVGGGFNILVGVQHKKGLFAEFKVGMIDSPSVKFAVGYVFK